MSRHRVDEELGGGHTEERISVKYTDKLGTYGAIAEAESKIIEAQRAYLRRFGWDARGSTPGSYWLWQRDFADVDKARQAAFDARPVPKPPRPYGVITADTELAVGMTHRVLDHDNDPKDGEGED